MKKLFHCRSDLRIFGPSKSLPFCKYLIGYYYRVHRHQRLPRVWRTRVPGLFSGWDVPHTACISRFCHLRGEFLQKKAVRTVTIFSPIIAAQDLLLLILLKKSLLLMFFRVVGRLLSLFQQPVMARHACVLYINVKTRRFDIWRSV